MTISQLVVTIYCFEFFVQSAVKLFLKLHERIEQIP